MTDISILSNLCRICNSKTPKYCCPRCRCLTCSLACYKRHKTWSQCSGKRDPGVYVKPSRLNTAAGIDHDFNFLSGIDRSIEQADRYARDNGISLDDFVLGRQQNTKLRLSRSLDATGVIIHKAPQGMSRQKQNSTHVSRFNRQDCVSWTIEWVLPDGSRKLRNTDDYKCIRDAYLTLCGNESHRKLKNFRRRKFRNASKKADQSSATLKEQRSGSESSPMLLSTSRQTEDNSSLQMSQDESNSLMTNIDSAERKSGLDGTEISASFPAMAFELIPYLYLHRPLTPGSTRVLIPISPSATIKSILKSRVILEFPTVYVLHEPPHSLPVGYQLERDYILQARKAIQELEEELKPFLDESLSRHGQNPDPVEGDEDLTFDETKVMESLQRDLAAATASHSQI